MLWSLLILVAQIIVIFQFSFFVKNGEEIKIISEGLSEMIHMQVPNKLQVSILPLLKTLLLLMGKPRPREREVMWLVSDKTEVNTPV